MTKTRKNRLLREEKGSGFVIVNAIERSIEHISGGVFLP